MFTSTVAHVGATILALYLAAHFLTTWAAGIRNGNPFRSRAQRRRRLALGAVVATVLFAALVAVIWS